MNPTRKLLKAWDRLAAAAQLKLAGGLGAELALRYSEGHRRFHTTEHLWQVTNLLEEQKADWRLLLAAWFHDAVYEPGRNDNETRSADLARGKLKAAGLAEDEVSLVADAILATASHYSPRAEFALLLDADLSILGASARAYATYRQAIREEYHAIPEPEFKAGRLAFVRALLARPAIFVTPAFKARFETQARTNLQAELEELSA